MGFRMRGSHLPGGKAHRFFERAAILTVLRGGLPFVRNVLRKGAASRYRTWRQYARCDALRNRPCVSVKCAAQRRARLTLTPLLRRVKAKSDTSRVTLQNALSNTTEAAYQRTNLLEA